MDEIKIREMMRTLKMRMSLGVLREEEMDAALEAYCALDECLLPDREGTVYDRMAAAYNLLAAHQDDEDYDIADLLDENGDP